MAQIPEASFVDNLRLNLCHVLPYYLRGIFTRNRTLYSLLTTLRWHPFSARFGNNLRLKYGCDYLYMRMLRRKTLFVFDNDGIKHVLQNSPTVYAEANLKRTGMSHFQPHAVTVSRGQKWHDRRQFNTAVLESDNRVHTSAGDFLAAVEQTTRTAHQTWGDFEKSFERIMLRVVLGAESDLTREQSRTQKQLMRQANRVFGLRKSGLFDAFHGAILGLIHTAPKGLASLCPHAPQSSVTKPDDQLSHWMFALRDTVATNTARAMALIAAHPQQEQLVREEINNADLSDPNGIDSLRLLEGCVQEAMRLWPSTPLLVRETTQKDLLGQWVIPPKTQVVIANNYHHRDTSSFRDADQFVPDRWRESSVNYKFNHLSNGPQGCAGKNLALFLAKAFIATAMAQYNYELQRPRIAANSPVPYMCNHFKLRFSCTTIDRATR